MLTSIIESLLLSSRDRVVKLQAGKQHFARTVSVNTSEIMHGIMSGFGISLRLIHSKKTEKNELKVRSRLNT